jgi:hypothetical protein
VDKAWQTRVKKRKTLTNNKGPAAELDVDQSQTRVKKQKTLTNDKSPATEFDVNVQTCLDRGSGDEDIVNRARKTRLKKWGTTYQHQKPRYRARC